MKQKYCILTFLGALSALTLASCGGGTTEATETILFSASQYLDGVTYKINLKGLSDGTATFKCLQAETPVDLSGTYTYTDGVGYNFAFGDTIIPSGYNAYAKSHYVATTVKLTSSYTARYLMSVADETFKAGANYVDPYDKKASILYSGTSAKTGETIKLRDYGDGTFDLMSFDADATFDYGAASTVNGVYGYTLTSDSSFLARKESTTKPGNYHVTYTVSVGSMFSNKTYENELYALKDGVTVDEAFPDPRGAIAYTFTGTNNEPIQNGPMSNAVGTITATQNLWLNDAGQRAYELVIGDDWYNEEGTYTLNGDAITFAPGQGAPYTGSLTGGYTLSVVKSSFFGPSSTYTFTMKLKN